MFSFVHHVVPGSDLKPGNILINADCTIKICDFGLSRSGCEDDEELTQYVVTRWYRAPEIMLAYSTYGPAVDVWAVGCIFGEMLLKQPLFKGRDYVDMVPLLRVLVLLGRA